MNSGMFRLFKNNEILNTVICFYTVNVVNVLVFIKYSLKVLFHEVSMFKNVFTVNSNADIARRMIVFSAFPCVMVAWIKGFSVGRFTSPRAKFLFQEPRFISCFKYFFAKVTFLGEAHKLLKHDLLLL